MERASFKYPNYSFKFAEDDAALVWKCSKLDTLLSSDSGSANVNETQKLQSKLSHAWKRFNQMNTAGDVALKGKKRKS